MKIIDSDSGLEKFGKNVSDLSAKESKTPPPAGTFNQGYGDPAHPKNGKTGDITALVQWSICGPNTYKPVSFTFPKLEKGIYNIYASQNHGIVFERKTICVDDLLRFPDSVSDKILKEITIFWNKGDKFKFHGFLHRRGYLLHGPAGSGKTCLVQQIIADIVNSDGLVFQCTNHPSVFNDGLANYRKVEPDRPVVCLFEDIDAIVDEYGEDEILTLLDGENQIDKVLNIACPAPETLILKTDLTWQPAGDLKVGDELIAFDENAICGWHVKERLGRKYRTAKVTSTGIITKPRFQIITDSGTNIIVSEKHPFLIKRGKNKSHVWKYVDEMEIGDCIVSSGKPWKLDTSYEGGYLAGQFDAEGSLNISVSSSKRHTFKACWTQSEGPLIGVMESLLKNRNFDFATYKRKKERCSGGGLVPKSEFYKQIHDLQINGGRWGSLRLLGSLRPIRLLNHPRLKDAWEDVRIGGNCMYEKVVSVKKIGNGPVVALSTTTKTFIGEGLFQHNTTNYPEKLDPRLIARPRRFDRVMEIDMPPDKVRKMYFEKKLKIDGHELKKWVNATEGFSFAACAELVISVMCFEMPFFDAVERLREMTDVKISSSDYKKGPKGFRAGVGFGKAPVVKEEI